MTNSWAFIKQTNNYPFLSVLRRITGGRFGYDCSIAPREDNQKVYLQPATRSFPIGDIYES